MSESLQELQAKFNEYKAMNLNLNMQRGQPSDENFDISNPMLTIVDENDLVTESGVSIRNYPGGIAGLQEARDLFSTVLGVKPEETIVGNNASLKMLVNTLMWGLIKGLKNSDKPWCQYNKPKMIVTVPGYDRHFKLLDDLGFEMVQVSMTTDGPNMDEVEKIAASDEAVKGIVFVPTYSNPGGETISEENVKRMASMATAAKDFTIFADDAYAVHHLSDEKVKTTNLLRACEDAGNPERVYIFGSTSKITFSGAGVGFMACSVANVKFITGLMGCQFIGPNKIEQLRHVKFINSFDGGIDGIMKAHAKILKPKFDVTLKVLQEELGGTGLAKWTEPKGGYFISLDTTKPVASRVIELAAELGVSLTPAGATFPFGKDPNNSNIRIAPTRPPVNEVEQAMKVFALCVKLASAE